MANSPMPAINISPLAAQAFIDGEDASFEVPEKTPAVAREQRVAPATLKTAKQSTLGVAPRKEPVRKQRTREPQFAPKSSKQELASEPEAYAVPHPGVDKPNKRTSVTLSDELHGRVRHQSIDRDTSLNAILISALEAYLDAPGDDLPARGVHEGPTARTSLTIDTTLRKRARHFAVRYRATFNDVVVAALERYLANEERA